MPYISVFGLGYVGTVLLGCLARDGHHVVGVDIDQTKLDLLKAGKSPVIEDGMDQLCSGVFQTGNAEVTKDIQKAIQSTNVTFVCVGTPSMANGNQDQAALLKVTQEIGTALRDKNGYHVVVIRSTVIPGTVEEKVIPLLETHSGREIGQELGVCFMPEFLREGSSIDDYDHPPFTVVGSDSERAVAVIRQLFDHLPADFVDTDIKTAEMIKYCCNAFHALKITFANEVGRIGHALGIDSRQAMEVLCRDRLLNISPRYMRPGFAFGGSCLPKDLRGLLYAGKENDVEVPMIEGILKSNHLHIEKAVEEIVSLGRKTVGLVGLSFKNGTDDLRESPYVLLAERLIGKGWDLIIYDPKVRLAQLIGSNKSYIENAIPHMSALLTDNADKLIQNTEVIVVAHGDETFFKALYANGRPDLTVIDLDGNVDTRRLGCECRAICW